MRTPYGFECKYFYGNYFRGRNQEECRLIGNTAPPNHWSRDLCQKCPVPSILRANACEHMELKAQVMRSMLGLIKKVEITAFCHQSQQAVKEPQVGCGLCHPLPFEFLEKRK